MQSFRADIVAANDNRLRRRRRIFMSILLLIALVIAVGFYQTRHYLFDGLPKLPTKSAMWELNLQPNLTLLDKDGHVIGHRGPYIGRPLKLTEMPEHLPNAFLAIEDERFYDHTGIDRKAIFRAFFENSKAGKKLQGGSTLTQQLVKNMVLTPERTYRRKFQEMWLAYEMEQQLSKPEILELYLNRIDLGPRIFGVEAAANRYFGKSAAQLDLSEAALLAALPKAPSRLYPIKNYDEAWERAKLVLRRMSANNFITFTQMSAAEDNPPVISDAQTRSLNDDIIGHVFDHIADQATGLVGSQHKDLIIQSTLDPEIQIHAHNALKTSLEKNANSKKISEGSLVAIETRTGAVRALIGGKDYAKSKFNRAVQAKRQPGSSFKAFVYAAAFESGFTPGTVRIDQPTNIDGWEPENYTHRYRGPMTLREAMKLSINTIAAQIGNEVGPSRIAEIARRFGISTPMRSTYSIALGSSEVTLLELTNAYMVFANTGLKRNNFLITSIKNTRGDELYKRPERRPERVYGSKYANQMTAMLRDVINTGTGHGAKFNNRDIAGKTGTSQDYRDAWFIGFSSDYTTGVWVGNDDNSPTNRITGGLTPTDIWKDFMIKAHKGKAKRALLDEDQETYDADVKSRIDFYDSLSKALITERNIANGLTPPQQISTLTSPN